MKKILVIVSFVLPLFMLLFLGVGYAAINKEIVINGLINAKPTQFSGVYITNVVIEDSTYNNVDFEYVKPTNLSTTVNVTSNGFVTYKVTVHNNSNATFYYQEQLFMKDHESNHLIGINGGITVITKDKASDANVTFDNQDWIPSQQYRDFYITYQYGNNARGNITTYINFDFEKHVDSLSDELGSILNDPVKYSELTKALDAHFSENNSNVIGSVGDDAAIIERIFGQKPTVMIDGEEKPVTIMIQKENVDGKTTGDKGADGSNGNDYTMYMTVDDLSGSGEAQTYVVTYIKDEDGNWVQIGQMYSGKAPIIDYDPTDGVYTPAIDISQWKADPNEYVLIDGISYKVGQEQGDQYDKMSSIEDLMSTIDYDIFNEIDNSKFFKKIYDIIVANAGSTTPEVVSLRTIFMNGAKYYVNYNNGQEFKVVRQYTRAEISSFLVELQKALDYYNQVHTS